MANDEKGFRSYFSQISKEVDTFWDWVHVFCPIIHITRFRCSCTLTTSITIVMTFIDPHFRIPSINAQCRSMPIKIVALIPMPINSDQFLSMPDQAELIRHWSALIGIDQHWSILLDPALRGIDRHWEEFQINAMIFDRHWSALGIERGSPDICQTSNEHKLAKCNLNPQYSDRCRVQPSKLLKI